MTIKYDTQLLQTRLLIEQISGTPIKDCLPHGDRLLIIVQPGQMGITLGKHKANAQRLERLLKKRIQIVEYSNELPTFINNLLQPLHVDGIREENSLVTITVKDSQTKAYVIGSRAQNLKRLEETVQHYYPKIKIKVV